VWTAVRATGVYVVAYHPHWYTQTDATLKLWFRTKIYGGFNTTVSSETTLLDIHNKATAAWVDTVVSIGSGAMIVPVQQGFWIALQITAFLEADGHSDHALVDADFCSGDNRIWVSPPTILPSWLPPNDWPIL
jgi:hypothetical protein